jgi:23S rRNA (uracil747-C5)-methyltransferase
MSSPEPSFCAYFNEGRCASCSWIELAYPAQLAAKEARIRDALDPLSPTPLALEPSIGSAPRGFRNRAKLVVTGTVDEPIIGLAGDVAAGTALDQGRELLACPIHHPALNALIGELPAFIRLARLAPYRIAERQGELKGLIAFHSPGTGETYLRFVLRSQECVSRLRKHLPSLLARFPSLTCVSANLQPVPHAILEGPEEIFLTEASSISHCLGPVPLRLAPQAFTQTHLEVATQLYATAARWIAELEPRRMLELYCGQGAFSFFAARALAAAGSLSRLHGIDLNAAAVAAAQATAREQGFAHLSFACLDAARGEGAVADEIARFAPDLILANPPRRGLADGVRLLEAERPAHFIYSSCSIHTLATDLARLAPLYAIRRAQLFDMFPHTPHFETLVWLTRRSPS